MTGRQIREEAARLVGAAAASGETLVLAEYISPILFREDHPEDVSLNDYNAIMRAAMKEAIKKNVPFRRRFVR